MYVIIISTVAGFLTGCCFIIMWLFNRPVLRRIVLDDEIQEFLEWERKRWPSIVSNDAVYLGIFRNAAKCGEVSELSLEDFERFKEKLSGWSTQEQVRAAKSVRKFVRYFKSRRYTTFKPEWISVNKALERQY